jgi:hypothetical protein
MILYRLTCIATEWRGQGIFPKKKRRVNKRIDLKKEFGHGRSGLTYDESG